MCIRDRIEGELQLELLKTAYPYVRNKEVSGIRISTRPDYISPEILDRLKQYGVSTIELGVQSMDDEVLRFSGRGHCAQPVSYTHLSFWHAQDFRNAAIPSRLL